MAAGNILFHDGLGQYTNTADMAARFLTATGTLGAGPRTGAKELNGGCSVGVTPSTASSGIAAVRVNIVSLTTGGAILAVFESDGVKHLSITCEADGSVKIIRGNVSGTLLKQSAAGVVTAGQRYFLECKWTISDASGVCEVRVNEVVAATTDPSADTRNGGTAGTWSRVVWNVDGIANYKVGDVYVGDGDVYWGECQTDYHAVTGAGAHADFTPSAGSNYQNVDDIPHDSDTTYNASSTLTHRDSFTHEALKHNGSAIQCVTVVAVAKKQAAGTSLLKTGWRHGSTDYDSTNDLAPSDAGYRHLSDVPMMVNPGTGVAWVESDFDAGEVAYEKTA